MQLEKLVEFFTKIIVEDRKFMIFPNFPGSLQMRAERTFYTPEDRYEMLLGLYVYKDQESKTAGFAVSTRGVYWRNNRTPNQFKAFKDLTGNVWYFHDRNTIMFGGLGEQGSIFIPDIIGESAQSICDFINRVISEYESLRRETGFMLSENGRISGPYNREQIIGLIREDGIDPEKTRIKTDESGFEWKDLMSEPVFEAAVFETRSGTDQSTGVPGEIKGSSANARRSINELTFDELLMLPGFDIEKAEKMTRLRSEGRRYHDMHSLASDFDLEPHHAAEIQKQFMQGSNLTDNNINREEKTDENLTKRPDPSVHITGRRVIDY